MIDDIHRIKARAASLAVSRRIVGFAKTKKSDISQSTAKACDFKAPSLPRDFTRINIPRYYAKHPRKETLVRDRSSMIPAFARLADARAPVISLIGIR
jgi:hypothetical protein